MLDLSSYVYGKGTIDNIDNVNHTRPLDVTTSSIPFHWLSLAVCCTTCVFHGGVE